MLLPVFRRDWSTEQKQTKKYVDENVETIIKKDGIKKKNEKISTKNKKMNNWTKVINKRKKPTRKENI